MTDTHNNRPAYRLGRITTVCPACHRRRFKPYVDAQGRVLDPTCGRCNRECSCGYRLTPRQFFEQQGIKPPRSYSTAATAWRPRPSQPSTMSDRYVLPTLSPTANPLKRWLASLFGDATASAVWLEYGVGWSAKLGRVVWWLRDRCGQVRSGKLMAYGADGHRLHSLGCLPTWAHTLLSHAGVRGFDREAYRFRGCVFGEWLASTPEYASARLIVMESEKSAIVAACRLRQLGALGRWLPVATGGCGGLKADLDELCTDPWHRLACLRGRDVVILPDADKVDEWTHHALTLRPVCHSIRVVDIRRWGAAGSDDIADIIERRVSKEIGKRREAASAAA